MGNGQVVWALKVTGALLFANGSPSWRGSFFYGVKRERFDPLKKPDISMKMSGCNLSQEGKISAGIFNSLCMILAISSVRGFRLFKTEDTQ